MEDKTNILISYVKSDIFVYYNSKLFLKFGRIVNLPEKTVSYSSNSYLEISLFLVNVGYINNAFSQSTEF